MENQTSSICEAWHRATKRVAGGPRPTHDLGESARRINKRTEQNETAKAKKATYDATSIPSKAALSLRVLRYETALDPLPSLPSAASAATR